MRGSTKPSASTSPRDRVQHGSNHPATAVQQLATRLAGAGVTVVQAPLDP